VPSIPGVCCQLFPTVQQPHFVSLNDFKTQLEQAGVMVEESMQRFEPFEEGMQTFDGWPLANASETRTLDLHFPEMAEGETVRVQALLGLSVTADGQNPKFVAEENIFVSPESLIVQLRKAKLPMTLEGWHNPTLRIGQTAVMIGTRETLATGASWYANILLDSVMKGIASNASSDLIFTWNQQLTGVTTLGKHIYSLRVNDRPGTVYGLLMPYQDVKLISIAPTVKQDPNWVSYTLARVDDRGVLQFVDGSAKVIEFVKSFKGIAEDLEFLKANKFAADRLNKLGYGLVKRPAKAMLVRLTGRLDTNTTEIVVPAKTRLMGLSR
jgi:hypothetical protein